ncbi:MAG: sigma-70 family RNA polymerase sigma factor [Jatrophihabitantaceae bacterium]
MADEQDQDREEDEASSSRQDLDLARAFIGGDNAAFDAFYRRYARPVHDYALGIVRDRSLAEDVTQTTFLRAYEQRTTVRDPAAARAWLYRIAHNTAVNQVSRTVRTDELPDDAPIASTGPGPEQSAEQTDTAQLVWDAAASLEPRQFTVLDLALRKGLSSAEIGEVLGLDAAQASLALHRSRDALGNAVRYLLVARRRRHCDRLAELVPVGVRALTVEQRASVDRHMRRCPDCQHAALVLTTPDALFGAIPIAALPAVLIDWHTPAARPPPPTRHGLTRPRLWTISGATAGIAAAVVAAVLFANGATHHSQPSSAGNPPPASAAGAPLAAVATHPFTPIAALAPDTYYGASCPTTATCLAGGKDATGQPILSTSTDSGATWRTTHPAVQFPLGLITCTSPTHCIGAQNTGTSDVFLVSDDAGASWQPAPSPPLSALQSASCPTANDCLAVGGNQSGVAEAVATSDGGHSWHPATAPGPAFSVDCVDPAHCWAAGAGAWFTTDLGASWRTISPPPTFEQATGAPPVTGPGIGGFGIVLNGIAFGSDTNGIVFGGAQCGGYRVTQCASALFRTTNGGTSWTFWASSNVDAYGDGNYATCRGSSCLLITDTFTNSVLVSTGDGITWTRRQTFDGQLTGITCDPNGDLCLLLGATGIYVDHTG